MPVVKTGGRLVKHVRYYWLLSEGHLTRRLFASMLGRIAGQAVPAGKGPQAWAPEKTIRKPPGMTRCLRKPIAQVPVSNFRTGRSVVPSRWDDPGRKLLEPLGWKQTGVYSL